MMRAAVYKSSCPKGVTTKTIPIPQITGNIYEPNAGNYPKLMAMTLMLWFMKTLMAILSLLRSIIPGIPGPYGAYEDRHMILCKVHAVGINPVDAKRLYGDKIPPIFYPFLFWMLENRVCGIDFSGTVVGVPKAYKGNGSQVLKQGDEIYGEMPPFVGSMAEYVLVPSDMIALKPKNMSFAMASAIPLVGLTALQALEGAENDVNKNCKMFNTGNSASVAKNGLNVLILGASGGTGHIAVQIAKARGHRVTAVCGSRNRDWVDSLGSDCTICYDSGEDLLRLLHDQVDEFGAYNIVFDSVSSDDPRDASHGYENRLRNTKSADGSRSGVIDQQTSVYLMLGGHVSDWIKAHFLRFCGLNLFGRNRLLFWVRFPICFEYLNVLRKYCESGMLTTSLANTYPFTDDGVRQAFGDIMSRRTTGKLAVEMSSDALLTTSPHTVTLAVAD